MKKITKLKINLKKNGFALVEKFFCKCPEYKNFKKNLLFFLNNAVNLKKVKNYDKIIIAKFKKNKKISAYINDNVNKSPSLQRMLASRKLISLLGNLFDEKEENVIFNNQRFRIQIPGNDEIANLPWHQDSHYNSIKNTKSIVAWVSLSNINSKMGPIIFKIGSHKFGIQKKIKIKKKNGGDAFEVNINNRNFKKLKEAQLETCAGDLILIDMMTVHASGNNKSASCVKYSAQARYHIAKKK